MIYLDNAATSYPKAPGVGAAMARFIEESAGNPGRSGHRLAVAAGSVVADTRRRVATLIGAADPSRVVFTLNATDAINQALWGLLRPGDRVVCTSIEHNAVARPLHALGERGVEVERVPCGPDGSLDLADLEAALRWEPARLVVVCHASNVTGTILPVDEAARLAHEHGAAILVDAAQTAGVLPIDVAASAIDLLAFPGHKGLLGPTGTGALYVAPGIALSSIRQGGTGTRSEEERQPAELPEALEAGTVNTVGIAGLGAALGYLEAQPPGRIRDHELAMTAMLLDGLQEIPGLRIHGPANPGRQVATVSITLEGWEPIDLGAALDSAFEIAVRPGLHCAPLAHRTIGTYPRGTVRLSPGCFTSGDDVTAACSALRSLAAAAIS